MRRKPPDILITTPESLYLMLTSGVREILTGVEAVIVDEIHAVAQSKRGAHLALTLERLDAPARTGGRASSPADRALGDAAAAGADRAVPGRPEARVRDRRRREPKELDLEIVVPVEDMAEPGAPELPQLGGRPGRGRAARPRPLDLAGDLPGAAASWSASTPRRSSSSTTAAPPSGSPSASTSWPTTKRDEELPATEHGGHDSPSNAGARADERRRRDRPRPPRLALPRGAARGRGAAQVRAAPLPGRDLLARAGDRHGRRRPGDPGRVAEVGHPRPAAGRPRRPHARRGLARAGSSPSSAPTCSSARSSPSGCARARSRRR